jgi:formylglycine-generating enzyme required for sulfatase activity
MRASTRIALAVTSSWLIGCRSRDPAEALHARSPRPTGMTSSPPTSTATTSASSAPEQAPPAVDAPHELPRQVDDMLLVPAGSFVMGADSGGEPDEHPSHRVELPAYYLDATEVSNERYGECVATKQCRPPSPVSADAMGFGPDRRFRGPKQPVSSVSWDDAAQYCAWRGKRLPTEAELERAARGDDGRIYPWGNESPSHERAVYEGAITRDVGTHPAGDGPFGHHDLAGNVWEWAADVYDPYAYRRDGAARGEPSSCERALEALDELRKSGTRGFTGSNPIPTECERVLRGGGFNYGGAGLRASNRVHHPPRYRIVVAGFRCAKDAK